MRRKNTLLNIFCVFVFIFSMFSLPSPVFAEEEAKIDITQISISNNALRIDWTPISNITGYNVIYKDKNNNQIKKNFVDRNNCFDTLKNYQNVAAIDIIGVLDGGKTVKRGINLEQYEGVPLNFEPVLLGASIVNEKTKIVINPDLVFSKISVFVNGVEYPVDLTTGCIDEKLTGKQTLLCKVELTNSRIVYGKVSTEFTDYSGIVREQTPCAILGRYIYEGGWIHYDVINPSSYVCKAYDGDMYLVETYICDNSNDFTFRLIEGVRYIEIIGADDGGVILDDLFQPFENALIPHQSDHPFIPYNFSFETSHEPEEKTNEAYFIPKIRINSDTFLTIVVNNQIIYQDLSTHNVGTIKIPLTVGTNKIQMMAYTPDGKKDGVIFNVIREAELIAPWAEVAPIISTEGTDIIMTFEKNYDGSVVNMPQTYIAGKATGAQVVLLNDVDLNMDINGNFRAQISLKEGNNTIFIKAMNDSGAIYTKELNIVYEVPNLIIDVNSLQEIEKEYKKIPKEPEPPAAPSEPPPAYEELLKNPGHDNEVIVYAALVAGFFLLIIIIFNFRKSKNKDKKKGE